MSLSTSPTLLDLLSTVTRHHGTLSNCLRALPLASVQQLDIRAAARLVWGLVTSPGHRDSRYTSDNAVTRFPPSAVRRRQTGLVEGRATFETDYTSAALSPLLHLLRSPVAQCRAFVVDTVEGIDDVCCWPVSNHTFS